MPIRTSPHADYGATPMLRRWRQRTIVVDDSEEAPMTTVYTRRGSRRRPARSLAHVRVGEAMHRGVITCAADAPLAVVARVLAAHRIHCVAVASANEPGAWGIVSDLDLLDAAFAGELSDRTAGEAAASCTLTVQADETLERAAQLMHEYRESHLVVVDSVSHVAVGVLSTLDIADALSEITSEES